MTLKKGDETVNTWDSRQTEISLDDVNGFWHDEKDAPTKDGEEIVVILRNGAKPDQTLEVRFNPDKKEDTQDVSPIARTLHPTGNGHAQMGVLVVNKLKETKWPPPNKDLEPLPPNNNKALSIMMEKDGDNYQWIFYDTPRGEAAGCNTNKNVVFYGPTFTGVNIDEPPNPSGDYNMNVWGRPCKWAGNGDNPGELICNDEHISCQKATADAKTIDCPNSSKKQHEGAFCEFFLESDNSIPAPAPAPPPSSTPSGPTKAMSIVLEEYIHDLPPTTMEWVFFATEFGKDATCDKNGATRLKDISGPLNFGDDANLGMVDNPPNPAGTFKLNVHGEDCEYSNDNSNPGGLFCGDKKYDCHDDPNRGGGDGATKECLGKGGFEQILHHPVITCEW